MSLIRQVMLSNLNTAQTVYGELPAPRQAPPRHKRYDVAVIGGGLAGLATALELRAVDKSVILLEADRVGTGASGRNGGQLWPGTSLSIVQMTEKFGSSRANQFWQVAHTALATIHQRMAQHPTRCDYKPGTLKLALNQQQARQCEQEATLLQAAGLEYASYIPADKLRSDYIASDRFYGGILYAAPYGHINPLQHVLHLANLLEEAGGELVEQARVLAVERQAQGYQLRLTERTLIEANTVVLACGAKKNLLPQGVSAAQLTAPAIPAQSVILATEPFPAELGKQLFRADVCYADDKLACDYARLATCADGSGRVRLLYGGADAFMQFRASAVIDVYRLKRTLYRTFPLLKQHGVKVETVWGGHECLARLSVPAVEEIQPGLYSLSSFGGQGNVLATLCGSAVARHICSGSDQTFNLLCELAKAIPLLPRSRFLAQLILGYEIYCKNPYN